MTCPCGLPADYSVCCGSMHDGSRSAETAEKLMRSRYSAFVTGNGEYLLATWHPATRPAVIQLDESHMWMGLEIRRVVDGGPFDTEGNVEFVAHHIDGAQHETSAFSRVEGKWVYVDGEISPTS